MSGNGKGKKSGGGRNKNSGGRGGNSNPPEPTLVSGWQYHMYAQNDPIRYAYIGKDEDTGEPEFLDYGPKGGGR